MRQADAYEANFGSGDVEVWIRRSLFVYLNVPKTAIYKFLQRLLDSKKNVGGLCPPTLLV